MDRIYSAIIKAHLDEHPILVLTGPRQVGKSHLIPGLRSLSWDNLEDRKKIVQGPEAVADFLEGTTLAVFDELHQYSHWKTFLSAFLKAYSPSIKMIITGRREQEGTSSFRIHPLSVAEIINPTLKRTKISPPQKIEDKTFSDLLVFGGFPEPFHKKNARFHRLWKKDFPQHFDLPYKEINLLIELLKTQVGEAINYSYLAKVTNVSNDTIKRWVSLLQSYFYCYTLLPWSKNVTRSLLKEPKVYLWDWSLVPNKEARKENFIASHLLKTVHFWTDRGFGHYKLYYLRDKERRGVDFLIVKNDQPWLLVDTKSGKFLKYFQEQLKTEFAFQLSWDIDYSDKNCFESSRPQSVPVKTFLSQLI